MEENYSVILGPTASGKSSLAMELAAEMRGEIVSADSAQVYKYMDIGTAKPTIKEQANVPHHLIDVVLPSEEFSVFDFQKLSQKVIKDIKKRDNHPIVVGGTGLFIRALTEDFTLVSIPEDKAIRKKYQDMADEKGNHYIHSLLKNRDDNAYNKLHPNDYRRVIRALEVYELSGKSIYELQRRNQFASNITNINFYGLYMDRQRLYTQINNRVDQMIEDGLVTEVSELLKQGISKDCNALKAIGYRQVVMYLENQIDFDEMVRLIKRDTRRYAKRQLTWFRNMDNIKWYNLDNLNINQVKEKIIKQMQENG
ncbi:tRNA (adenosine(37)-N6)-dimethylallyltransferase MiaA [Proteinivorax hydrogeniformans]|uniref:tRNA dimethylallyltransferase n=1 Tax=Proteinivorax hydrogeniformans TaxID=1826727 RepID=A0AAU8HX34_9FIRM